MTKIEQSHDAKQKALVRQARNTAGMIRGLSSTQGGPSGYAQLFDNLADEIEQLQKIVDERSKE